ncbi:hypothetical protein SAMN05216577_112103 [Pseudomonas citronellolis]|uniref:Radical SAM protein n=1 Tax=Pseudomonas citronellolis TaxID=53408 RepID=A0AAQ1HUK7_9PSED|nr:hypothetical protein SAMN05216577_112103 [Pseudomonas citronellolis]
MSSPLPPRGRGTASNPHNRFAPTRSEAEDDGWYQDEAPPCRATEVRMEQAKTVISRNQSPDVGFDRSINPYRGCEHGWICSAIGANVKSGFPVARRPANGAFKSTFGAIG